MASKLEFDLTPPTEADIPRLAQMCGDAFRTDTHTELKGHFKGKNHHAEGMVGALESWINHPRIEFTVAREKTQGKPVGFVCWGKRGYDAQSQAAPINDQSPLKFPTKEDVEKATEESIKSAPRTIAGLEDLTDANLADWMEYMMPPGTKCRYIVTLTVAPEYQSMGVGSALLRCGTDKADEEGVFCWVHSSMGATEAYEKGGFEKIGKLEVNLDDFAEGVKQPTPEGEMPWGIYYWTYMVRQPIKPSN